jgi:hypothetical protein
MTRFLFALFAFPLVALASGCDDHSHHATPSPAPALTTTPTAAANPVQAEMRLLTSTLQGAVLAIGMGDVRGVEHALHQLHSAKETTEKALKGGSYHPPKNGENLARFHELDEAFHSKLGGLVQASRANDIPRTAEAVGQILGSCQGCHSEFRP